MTTPTRMGTRIKACNRVLSEVRGHGRSASRSACRFNAGKKLFRIIITVIMHMIVPAGIFKWIAFSVRKFFLQVFGFGSAARGVEGGALRPARGGPGPQRCVQDSHVGAPINAYSVPFAGVARG